MPPPPWCRLRAAFSSGSRPAARHSPGARGSAPPCRRPWPRWRTKPRPHRMRARVAIWLHDRRAARSAGWPPESGGAGDASSPPRRRRASRRRAGPDAGPPRATRRAPHARLIVAPLRGWRRALGTLVARGRAPASSTADEALELAHACRPPAVGGRSRTCSCSRRSSASIGCSTTRFDSLRRPGDRHRHRQLRVVQMNDAARRARRRHGDLRAAAGIARRSEIAAWVAAPPKCRRHWRARAGRRTGPQPHVHRQPARRHGRRHGDALDQRRLANMVAA